MILLTNKKSNIMKAVIKISRDSYLRLKDLSIDKLPSKNNNTKEGLWIGIKRFAH